MHGMLIKMGDEVENMRSRDAPLVYSFVHMSAISTADTVAMRRLMHAPRYVQTGWKA